MNCQSVRRQLNALIDGERATGAGRFVAVLGHSLRCAECRAAWRSLRTQRTVARSLPLTPAPDRLKERIMANLPIIPDRPVAPSPRRPVAPSRLSPWLIRATIAVALVLTLAALLPGRSLRTIAAAEVAAAVQRANTWHLKGWKLREGKRIAWEVWGRRQPFFYREEFGDNLVFDDGHQRVETLPASGPGRGMALRLPSGEAPADTWWALLTTGNGWHRHRPWKETGEVAVFRWHDSAGATRGYAGEVGAPDPEFAGDSYYTVAKSSGLPVRYEYRGYWQDDTFEPRPGTERVVETLDAEYDVPLPDAVTRPALPKNVRLIDTLAAPAGGVLPTENTQRDRGLTAQLTPLAMDAQGHVLARVRAWLGNEKLIPGIDSSTTHLFLLDVMTDVRFRQVPGTTDTAFHDQDGRRYTHLQWPDVPCVPNGDFFLLFVPLEPLQKGTPLPRSLRVHLQISPGVWGEQGDGRLYSKWLWHQEFTWNLALPEKTKPIDLAAYAPREQLQWANDAQPLPMNARVADARSRQYSALQDYAKAIEWKKRVLDACNPANNAAQFHRLSLAQIYHFAGNREQAAEVLNEVVAISRRHPETRAHYRQSAEATLRHLKQRR